MANKKNTKIEPRARVLNIQLEPKADTPFYYANFIVVTHSAAEFSIGITRVPLPLLPDQVQYLLKDKAIMMEPTLQIIVPPSTAKGLIKALQDQVSQYESQFGEILVGVKQNANQK